MPFRGLFYFLKRCLNFVFYNKIILYILLFVFFNSVTFYFLGWLAVIISFIYALKNIILRSVVLKIKEKK